VFWNFSTFAAIATDGLTKSDSAKWFLFVVEQKKPVPKSKKKQAASQKTLRLRQNFDLGA
jgi:hypothetical protein